MCFVEKSFGGCTASPLRGTGLPKCPEPIDLEQHLQRMLFTKIQIEWIIETIKSFANSWAEIESIAEFPLNHGYGFKKDGGSKKGSKYNVMIGFAHEDSENKWTGKQSSRILLIKNK